MAKTFYRLQMKAGKNGETITDTVLAENRITSDIDYAGEKFEKLLFGDIVLIHKGSYPIALVKIIHRIPDEEISEPTFGIDYRVEVISWFEDAVDVFPELNEMNGSIPFPGTFKKVDNTKPTYSRINKWYTLITQNNFMQQKIDLLKYKNQIILQGPPGTGKTRLAKNIAEKILTGKESKTTQEQKENLEKHQDQFKLVQFHPAYSYEDFVRGITAKANGTSVEYKTEDKTLAKFAKDAKDSMNFNIERTSWIKEAVDKYLDDVSMKIKTIPGNKFSIPGGMSDIDRVGKDDFHYDVHGNQGTGYTHTKELLINTLVSNSLTGDIADFKKLDYNHGHPHNGKFLIPLVRDIIGNLKTTQKFQEYFDVYQERSFVLIIDEINRANLPAVLGELIYALEYRDEYVDSMYGILKEGTAETDTKIILPSNLYIIGTMNTADRSVGHIDYAIRRRFAYVDVLPTTEPIKSVAEPLFKAVSELFINNYESIIDWLDPKPVRSDFVAADFRPEDIWIGHSYFITKEDGDNGKEELKLKLKYEIIPILKEYLKDGLLQDSKEEKVNDKIDSLYDLVS